MKYYNSRGYMMHILSMKMGLRRTHVIQQQQTAGLCSPRVHDRRWERSPFTPTSLVIIAINSILLIGNEVIGILSAIDAS